ncbi:MAG: thioredoxin [Gemmatimonadetes bacterium]|nr:thioredoxin [Gemmatimonadota bacterium]
MSNLTITELSDATFAEEIEQHPGVAVVDFWAGWCGPCRMVAPTVEELAAEYAGTIKVAKLDIDANGETPRRFGIRSIPTLLFFRNGKVIDTVVGALPKAVLDQRFRAAADGQ